MSLFRKIAKFKIEIEALFIFAASLFLFLWKVSGQEVIAFESRFYLFAKEMWHHGVTAFPLTYGNPYPDYPATSTLLIYLSSLSLGGLSKFSAVLPSAIAAALTVMFTYLIGEKHYAKTGWLAVILLLMTYGFLATARSISLDIYPTLFVTFGYYSLMQQSDLQSKRWILLFYVSMFLAYLFRGPIGWVMVMGIGCGYYSISQEWKRLIQLILLGSMGFIFMTILLLACAYHAGGESFVQDVLRMEVVGRLGDHGEPVYYYFMNSFGYYALTYPFFIIAVIYFLSQKQYQKNNLFILKLLTWILVILIGMSIPGGKKIRYILPFVPALALFIASVLNDKNRVPKSVIAFLSCIFLLIYFVMLFVVESKIQSHEATQLFVENVETYRLQHHRCLAFYRMGEDGFPIKYLANAASDIDKPIFIFDNALLYNQSCIIIAEEKDLNKLPNDLQLNRVNQGHAGHKKMIAFQLK